jgi:hypothetical protein
MTRIKIPLILFLLAGCIATSRAESIDTEALLQRAETLFDHGQDLSLQDPEKARSTFRESAEIFSLLVDQRGYNSARIHVNAGNAWFFAEELGHAIAHYRLAEQRAPLDPSVRQNLAFARSQTLDAFETSSTTPFTPLKSISLTTYLLAFGLSNLLLWSLLATKRFGISIKGIRWVTGLVVVLGLAALVRLIVPALSHEGVVIARETTPRMGNNDAYQSAFSMPLHAGTEFKVLEERGDWIRIKVETGDAGWVKSEAVSLL